LKKGIMTTTLNPFLKKGTLKNMSMLKGLAGILFFIFLQVNLAVGQAADGMFSKPYVDVDEWRNEPVRHRYVHGGFEGTETRFSFYFPPKDTFEGRFFQYITPVPDSEFLSQGALGEEDKISFALQNGAYFVEKYIL
jgi:hypothetical protein